MIVFASLASLPPALPCSKVRQRELAALTNAEGISEKRAAEALLWYCYEKRFPHAALPFDYPRSETGKPYFPNAKAFHFSLSHTKGYALCAAFSSPCGADIEQIGRLTDSVIAHIFHERERAYLAALPAQQRAEAAARIWCLREAYGKRLGTGLMGLGKDFYVLPTGETDAQGVQMQSFLPVPGFAAAVCATEKIDAVPVRIW